MRTCISGRCWRRGVLLDGCVVLTALLFLPIRRIQVMALKAAGCTGHERTCAARQRYGPLTGDIARALISALINHGHRPEYCCELAEMPAGNNAMATDTSVRAITLSACERAECKWRGCGCGVIADVCNPHLSVAMLPNQYLAGLATTGCGWTPRLHLVAMDLPPVGAAAV